MARRLPGTPDVEAGETAAQTADMPAELNKKELIDAVIARAGTKRQDAKPIVEAMLAVLGETIAAGRPLNLQPFGKLTINRTVEKPNARVVVVKLRQNAAKRVANSALAESAE